MSENNYGRLMGNIHAPAGLNDRVLFAARQRTAEQPRGWAGRLPGNHWRPVLRGAICAVCALALVLGTVRLQPVPGAGEQTAAMPAVSLDCAFGLTAYAAGTGETFQPNANGGLTFDSSCGVASGEIGHYTGCLFQVQGEGVKTVSLAVDRGGLYRSELRTGLTQEEVQALWEAEAAGGSVCNVYGESESGPMNAEVMTALGSSITEDFDPEARYGFWVPPELYQEDPDADLRQASWAGIDTFDGARLTVTVTFENGSEQSKTYTLSTGRLRVEYGKNGTRTMLPQLAGDEEPFVYGIYAVSETDSRWFQWPVQDSRTVSLGNPYGTVNGRFHSGIDIPAQEGAVILAAADGSVLETGFDAERGNYLRLDHGDGLETVYAHCRDFTVEEGDAVKAGEMLGAVGSTGMSTGPHLCFQVWQDGTPQNPVVYFDSLIRSTLTAERED